MGQPIALTACSSFGVVRKPMWIVALALRRPYTFVVMALVIIILTPLTILRTPADIFPDINIPVVSVVWFYTGMSPQDMADRIVANSERGITTTVNDIEHIESQSVYGLGVIKVFFRPGHQRSGRASRRSRRSAQTTVRGLPPGTTPPLIISYSASTTPIIQLGLEQQDAAGAGTVRSWAELPAHLSGDGAGRRDAVSLRRKDSPDPGGSRYAEAAGVRPCRPTTS